MIDQWCPYQAILCMYWQEWRPYHEALRAVPLPDNTVRPISRHPKYIRCQETRSRITDREETGMCRALDLSVGLPLFTQKAREALVALAPSDRKIIEMLSAYHDSGLQFDFGLAAEAWTTGRRGIQPRPEVPGYDAWMRSKSRRKKVYLNAWARSYRILNKYLVQTCEQMPFFY